MKWAALVVALAFTIPLAGWLRGNPRHGSRIWIAMGILPFAIEPLHLYMAMISWAYWPGFVKGAEISLIDVLAAAIYISLPRARSGLPFRLSMAIYFFSVLASAFQADVAEAALFYPWQLARMFLVYAVVAKATQDDRVVLNLLKGMTIGICFEACFVLIQKFGFGQFQPGGTFGNQNLLGMVSHFVGFPCFAWLLADKSSRTARLAVGATLIVAILTASRATIGLAAAGYAALFLISASRSWNARKARLAFVFGLMILVLVPVAISSLESRFSAAPELGDYDERAAFEIAASSMTSDHPLGIGANNYVVVANTKGYNEAAGVAPTTNSLSAHVHNVYFVVTCETGYIGLIAFLVFLLQPLVTAIVAGWRSKHDIRGDMLLGFGMTLVVVYIHSLYEWIFVTQFIQYCFALTVGCIAGFSVQLGYGRGKITYKNKVAATATGWPRP